MNYELLDSVPYPLGRTHRQPLDIERTLDLAVVHDIILCQFPQTLLVQGQMQQRAGRCHQAHQTARHVPYPGLLAQSLAHQPYKLIGRQRSVIADIVYAGRRIRLKQPADDMRQIVD